MQKQCKKVIRGSMFVHDKTDSEPGIICEECYRNLYYGKEAYTKAYKHCILSEAITPEMSTKICKCLNLRQDTSTDEPQSLFPIEEPNKHKDTGSAGEKCKLLQLGDMVALAKYHGLQDSVGVKPRSQKDTEKAEKQAKADSRGLSSRFYKHSISNEERAGESDFEAEGELEPKPEAEGHNRRLSALKTVQQLGGSSNVSIAEEAAGDTDIPLFFRKHAEKNPFGNVHMALRVGPLVVENGVSQ